MGVIQTGSALVNSHDLFILFRFIMGAWMGAAPMFEFKKNAGKFKLSRLVFTFIIECIAPANRFWTFTIVSWAPAMFLLVLFAWIFDTWR